MNFNKDFNKELVPGTINGSCFFKTPCGWCTRINNQCSEEVCASSVADLAARSDTASLLSTRKFAESVYSSFRKEVCSGCFDLRCDRDECDINACKKFVNYFEI